MSLPPPNTDPVIADRIADAAFLAQPWETRAEAMLDRAWRGIYHIYGLKKQPRYWSFQHSSLSTFDFDLLTRLVLGAHEYCLRVEIRQGGPGGVKVLIHPRTAREGHWSDRHPTIEQAIAKWREPIS